MQRDRFFTHHRRGLHHFFRCLKFAFGVDDLGTAFALGFGLLGHGGQGSATSSTSTA